MIILFGTHAYLKNAGPSADRTPCFACGNVGQKELLRARTWFTLFFIPIFPVSTKYIVRCTRCGREDVVREAKAEFDHNLRQLKQNKAR